MKVLITGSTGMVGSHVLKLALEDESITKSQTSMILTEYKI